MKYVVFLVGFVAMGVEILAGRLLAPLFGDSVLVWGSIIGSVLLALSLGYFVGGFIADTYHDKKLLLFAILGLAFSTLCMKVFLSIPFTHPLFASLVTTFLPGFFAGVIMPLALKEHTHSLKTLGVSYGSLSSFSTIGSVCGTFTTLFFFLPFFGATKTMLMLSLLAFITTGFLWSWGFLFLLVLPLLFFLHFRDFLDIPIMLLNLLINQFILAIEDFDLD